MAIWYPSGITIPSIAGVSCSFVHGELPQSRRETSTDWHRAGIVGRGILLMGLDAVETELTAVLYALDAEVDAWATSIQAYQGYIVSITNDQTDTAARVFLREVSNCRKTAARRDDISVRKRGELQIRGLVQP